MEAKKPHLGVGIIQLEKTCILAITIYTNKSTTTTKQNWLAQSQTYIRITLGNE